MCGALVKATGKTEKVAGLVVNAVEIAEEIERVRFLFGFQQLADERALIGYFR